MLNIQDQKDQIFLNPLLGQAFDLSIFYPFLTCIGNLMLIDWRVFFDKRKQQIKEAVIVGAN
jgi:hypothetical protein